MNHEILVNWGLPAASMSFLLCSGCAYLALGVTLLRLATQFYYERIAVGFKRHAHAARRTETGVLLLRLMRVFRLCGWCGYGLLSLAVLPSPIATAVYWLELPLLLWLVIESRRVALQLSAGAIIKLFQQLEWATQIETEVEASHGDLKESDLAKAVSQRIAAMRQQYG